MLGASGHGSLGARRNGPVIDNGDVALFDDPLTGFAEGQAFVVLDELDGIAFGTTDKALETTALGAEMEGRVLVLMVRTAGSSAFIAHAIELDAELLGDSHDADIVDLV